MRELWQVIDDTQKELNQCLKSLRQNGIAYAKAEKDYKVKLRLEVLKLKDEGKPVTLIPYLAYGEKDVSDLREIRDICETTYKANQEALNVKKIELKLLQSQYEREYTNDN